jgi:hypothetical protein
MTEKGAHAGRIWILSAVFLLSLLLAMGSVSCGGGSETPADTADEGIRLPPGMTEEDLGGLSIGDLESGAGGSGAGEEGEGPREPDAPQSEHSAYLSGARFTVVDVTRNDSNRKVLNTGQREVAGDYLEVELAVENAGDELVDLAQYSFRLESPGIEADDYRSYYGDVSVLGKYVSEHMISAALLDYADLTPVLYKLKIGESLEGVFLFFDLNPLSTAKNEGFSLKSGNDDAYLVIYKLRGSGSGDEVRISLAGLAD